MAFNHPGEMFLMTSYVYIHVYGYLNQQELSIDTQAEIDQYNCSITITHVLAKFP